VILETMAQDAPPLRLLLGRNALEAGRKQMTGMLAEFERWADVSASVDANRPEETAA
jgi:hypothetical protein